MGLAGYSSITSIDRRPCHPSKHQSTSIRASRINAREKLTTHPPKSTQPLRPPMPLVTLCGLPATGKTTFAEGLVAFLKQELPPPARVVLINEEGLRIGKREGYRGALPACGCRSVVWWDPIGFGWVRCGFGCGVSRRFRALHTHNSIDRHTTTRVDG